MRLFEAILDANHRAASGDRNAGLRPGDYPDSLPVAALTCIDPRLNPLLPEVLGIPEEQFIWLRNAGNIITSPLSSTMRSMALACAVKQAKEIAVIGHTDCLVRKTTTLQLLDRLSSLGIDRRKLPENLNDYFGTFSSERQNVIRGAEFVRMSPLIGPKIPVHGFLVDIESGKLEWLVNGYQQPANMMEKWNEVVNSATNTLDALKNLADFKIGDMHFPDTKIGEGAGSATDWLKEHISKLEIGQQQAHPPPPPSSPAPASVPVPPRIPVIPAGFKPRIIRRKP